MAGFNRVVLVGNLTRDPDYKQLPSSGQPVCRLGLAVNRQYKNRQTDSMIQEVCYIDIDVWGPQAESCRQYLQKGREVLIEGRLKLDTWEDTASGQKRSKHSIVADRVVFLSGGSEQSDSETKMHGATHDAPRSQAERELFDQIDAIKSRNDKKPKKAAALNTGELDFQDEPPFEDELPF